MRCGTTCFRGTTCFPRLKGRAPLGATLSPTITAIGSDALYLLALRRSLGVRGAKPPGCVDCLSPSRTMGLAPGARVGEEGLSWLRGSPQEHAVIAQLIGSGAPRQGAPILKL